MPIPQENFAAIQGILEKDILPVIPFQRYQRSPSYKMFGGFEPTNDQQEFYKENRVIPVGARGTSMQNNNLYFPFITGDTGGAGVMSSSLVVGYGQVPIDQAVVSLVNLYAAFTIGENVILSPGVVKDTFALSVQQTINSHAMDTSRQLYADGTGLIGTANANQASPSTAFVFAASLNGDIDYARFVPGNANGGTIVQIGTNPPVQVVAITAKNAITLATPQSWNAGDNLIKMTPDGQTPTELIGFNGIIGTGAYAGVTDPSWVSNIYTSFGSFSANGGNAALNNMWIQTTQTGDPSTVFMNGTLFNTYGDGLTSQKQFNYNDPLYAGWPTLQLMGQNGTIVLDWYCPDDHIYALTPTSMWLAYLEDIHWLAGTQGVLNRIPGTANFEATATMYAASFCNLRSGNSFMSGVSK